MDLEVCVCHEKYLSDNNITYVFTGCDVCADSCRRSHCEIFCEVKGARNFIAKGGKLALARSLLDRTPVAPVSDDVEELAVLKMMNVSQESKESFLNDLTDALKSYDYYGRQETKNGMVDIYVLKKTEDTVEELVIYNAGIYSLNSLYGNFTAESLLKLRK